MRLLLICRSIAPVNSIAAIRWTKIAKYLKKQYPDIHITVLTCQKDFEGKNPDALFKDCVDPLLQKDLQYFDEYWEVPDPQSVVAMQKKKKHMQDALRRIKSSDRKPDTAGGKSKAPVTVHPDRRSTSQNLKFDLFYLREYWEDAEMCKASMQYLKDKPLNFDVMVSSFSPAWTHRVAEQIKKKHPNIQWYADFRDPYARDSDTAFGFNLHRHFCQKHCSSANGVLVVADGLKSYTDEKIPLIEVTNGFDPEEMLLSERPDKFKIVFTGTMYENRRDIGIACKILKDLYEEGQINRDDAIVTYAGSHGDLARSLAQRYNAEAYFEDVGSLPRPEAMDLQRKAAILLQMNWSTKGEDSDWSGKVYEYMMTRKPILYLVSGDVPYSFAYRNIRKLGGCCYEASRHAETYPEAKQYVLEKYMEWKQTGDVTITRDESYVQQFSYPQIANKCWEIFDKKVGI